MVGVVATVKVKNKSDPRLVTALEVIATAGVRIEVIAGHWVEIAQEAKAIQETKVTRETEVTQEVIVLRERARVVRRVREVAGVEVEIKI